MKTLYLDCFSGISGDMCLAALLDLGVPLAAVEDVIARLGIPVTVEKKRVSKRGIRATRVLVRTSAPQPPTRSLRELEEILKQSSLPRPLAERVEDLLLRLARAEAAVHGEEAHEVHFHELGGLDTLVDLAGTLAGLECLGVQKVIASPLPLGVGKIQTAHGALPLPAPATLNLLQGIPTYGVPLEAELVTPTGAALVAALAEGFGPPPFARWEKIGYGAGARDLPQPNVLRAWLGECLNLLREAENREGDAAPSPLTFDEDAVAVVETQLDDLNPELLPYLRERLEGEGALDVTFTPALMKKGRPGNLVTVLAPPDRLEPLARVLFRESTALGVRWRLASRIKLFRTTLEVATPYGRIPVKLGFARRPDGTPEYLNLAPEYEACARRAQETGASLKEVYQAAAGAAREAIQDPSSKPFLP
ncbi:MAG: nickel pincer cofactor biosynthesis protein LarC [Firmicutes bacterium]|nr:nickel pincer cofactor biosynthesis protein LarC [Bacillota bacterium]